MSFNNFLSKVLIFQKVNNTFGNKISMRDTMSVDEILGNLYNEPELIKYVRQ